MDVTSIATGKRQLPLTVIQAIFVRCVFFLHSILAISRAATVSKSSYFWTYTLIYIIFIAEAVYIIVKRQGIEYKWVSSCILVFVCIDLCPIWILETNHTAGSNVDVVKGVTLEINNDSFLYAIEQTFLLSMIIGRWILPRGRMSRDKLSNLLLLLIGKACDMSDFFTLFQNVQVAQTSVFRYFVLSIWTLSVFQFPIVFTETMNVENGNKFFTTDIWSISVSVVIQEAPFLICRSYAIAAYGIVSPTILFFTCKNTMILLMDSYRVVSLVYDNSQSSVIRIAPNAEGS